MYIINVNCFILVYVWHGIVVISLDNMKPKVYSLKDKKTQIHQIILFYWCFFSNVHSNFWWFAGFYNETCFGYPLLLLFSWGKVKPQTFVWYATWSLTKSILPWKLNILGLVEAFFFVLFRRDRLNILTLNSMLFSITHWGPSPKGYGTGGIKFS